MKDRTPGIARLLFSAILTGCGALGSQAMGATPAAVLATGNPAPSHQLTIGELNDVYQIQQIMAFYSRAADREDTAAMACLVAPDGAVEIDWNKEGVIERRGNVMSRQTLFEWGSRFHRPPGIWNQHAIADPDIELHGDRATVSYRLLKTAGRVATTAADSTSKDPIMWLDARGYLQMDFKKLNGVWKIAYLQIINDELQPHDNGQSLSHSTAAKLVCAD